MTNGSHRFIYFTFFRRPNKAIRLFQALPSSQYGTTWVLMQIGRACYEKGDYSNAARAYKLARDIDRSCLEVSIVNGVRPKRS